MSFVPASATVSFEPSPPSPKPDKSPGGVVQSAVTTAGSMVESKVDKLLGLPSQLVVQPSLGLYQAFKVHGIEGGVTLAFDDAAFFLKRPPILVLADMAKGVGEDIAVVQESTEKAISAPDSEEAGKQIVVAGSGILSIASTLSLPEEGAVEKSLIRSAKQWEKAAETLGSGRAYSVAFSYQLKPGYLSLSRRKHFAEANKALLEAAKTNPSLQGLTLRMVGPRGGVTTPYKWTWQHVPEEGGMLHLMPTLQHDAAGPLQDLLHPYDPITQRRAGGIAVWGRDP